MSEADRVLNYLKVNEFYLQTPEVDATGMRIVGSGSTLQNDTNQSVSMFNYIKDGKSGELVKLASLGVSLDVMYQGCSLVSWAVQLDQMAILGEVLDGGANPNIKDDNGDTPLHIACRSGNNQAIYLLLSRSRVTILLDIENNNSDTPVMICIKSSNNEHNTRRSIRTLLEDTLPDLEHVNKDGFNALMLAINANMTSVVQLLVKNGAEVNASSPPSGDTPVMMAVQQGNPNLVQYFVDRGADLSATNNKGKTAYQIAVDKGDFDLADAIDKKMKTMM